MISFRENTSINLDITKICTLECPSCFRQDPRFNAYKNKYKDLSLDNFKKINEYFNFLNFCGNIGDPVFNPDFLNMLEISYNSNKRVKVNNAASHKSLNWYKEAFKANPSAYWIFGIDGLPKQSHLYRKNQDGEKLFEVMKLGKSMGITVEWQYLIFNYNQEYIEKAKALAKEVGIKINVWKTRRHPTVLKPDSKYIQHTNREIKASSILPKCLHGRELGHSAMGYITPCCWTADANVEEIYPELCNESTKLDNVNSIEEIINTKAWIEYEKFLSYNQEKAYPVCWKKCGANHKHSKEQI